jgi:hypothetical protein
MLENSSPIPIIHSPGRQFGCCCECANAVGALVVTVMDALVVLAVPLGLIVVGANTQVASDGRPEQARLMVPLNPLELVTLMDVDPEPPGAEINTVDCAEGISAKNPGVIVNDCDCAEVLAVKLESPL